MDKRRISPQELEGRKAAVRLIEEFEDGDADRYCIEAEYREKGKAQELPLLPYLDACASGDEEFRKGFATILCDCLAFSLAGDTFSALYAKFARSRTITKLEDESLPSFRPRGENTGVAHE